MRNRPILHADADAFFASVVMRRRPELMAVPFAVTAHVFIASANYTARSAGVRGGMLAQEALARCPDLVLIEVDRNEVEEASQALFDVFDECAVAVEPGSMEEGFLDVEAPDWDAALTAAREIRHRTSTELSLPVSIGIGRTKLVAKLASRSAKPDGFRVIGPDEEAHLRIHLPLRATWGVGERSLERLTQLGISTLGDLDSISQATLESACGAAMGRRLRGYRDGTDDAEVRSVSMRTTLSAEGAVSGFRRPDLDPSELIATCVQRICGRAVRAGLVGDSITITLRPLAGGSPILRRGSIPDPTADAHLWTMHAQDILDENPIPPLQGIGVTLTRLRPSDQVPAMLF